MLKINFLNNATTSEALMNLAGAVRFEYYEMHSQLLTGKLVSLNKELTEAEKADSGMTKNQVEAIRDEIRSVEANLQQDTTFVVDLQEVHDAVVLSMERSGCKYSNVRNILRIIAASENKKLFIYCLNFEGQEANLEALHESLDSVHVTCKLSIDGKSLATAEEYKRVNNELNKFMIYNFSLAADTAYTVKKTVRLNKEDLHKIHESYVKSVRAGFKTSKKTGETTFTGFTFNTLVKAVKVKGSEEYTYDYSQLVAKIAEIATAKISAE